MKQIIYIYIGLCLSISQTILYSVFDGKTQDLTVLSKLKTEPWGSDFEEDKPWRVSFLYNDSKKDRTEWYRRNCSVTQVT